MALPPGTRIGPYDVQSALGAGGMGEVYRARDTKLRRDVAIKILPAAFAADPDRVIRFQREAELLAALNHPNVAAVYGIEETALSSAGPATYAIVMELVEGETLADRIARGVIDLDETTSIARQLADGLEAAHDRGVVHRDLKPANIKVTPDGKVKILDFGLAKMFDPARAGTGTDHESPAFRQANSPTMTSPAQTIHGTILGTAAYMSPEQARGRPVDRRTDVWAFGCVLFEMLTRRRAFEGGETVSDTIASILRNEPDWNAIPATTPPEIRKLLQRCLQKDPQRRLPHIGIARLEIDEGRSSLPALPASAAAIAPGRPLWKRALSLVAVAVAAGALGGSIAWYLMRPAAAPPIRFPIALGDEQVFTGQGRRLIAISPDGNQIAYSAERRLFRRSLSSLETDLVVNEDTRAGTVTNIAFSPDGRSMAFVFAQDRTLRRVSVDGGTPVTIASLDVLPYGVSWDAGGILFEADGSIMRVSPDGGKPETLLTRSSSDRLRSPQMLPDGRTVLFTLVDATANTRNVPDALRDPARIVTQSLTSSEPQVLIEGAVEGRYLPSGHLAYVSRGVLFVVPFDVQRVRVTGVAVPLVEGVRSEGGTAHYSVSATGSLAYVPGTDAGIAGDQNLGLIDRTGKVDLLKLPPATFRYPRLSPDGSQVAVEIDSANEANIWIYELSGASALRRLTFGGRNRVPVWSADGQRVAFQSDRDGDLAVFAQRADGAGPAGRLTTPDKGVAHVPESWSAKGDLLFAATRGPEVALWAYSERDRRSQPFGSVRSSRQPTNAAFSPNGSWVAYQSNETGTSAVYVQSYPTPGSRFQASPESPQDDPHHPLWSHDGAELFYVAGPNRLVVTNVTERSGLTFSNPVLMQTGTWKSTFGGPTTIRNYDVFPDGKRFIGVIASSVAGTRTSRSPEIQIVLNWLEEVRRRVPAR